jgi:hypothetical protein
VREKYWKAHTKKEKSRILDEYCADMGQARKSFQRKDQEADGWRESR